MGITRLVAPCLTVFAVAACAGPTRTTALLPPLADMPSSGTLTLRVRLSETDAAGRSISPNYIGQGTKGISVRISGPTTVRATAGLTIGAKGCKSKLMYAECVLKIPGLSACPSKKRCYTATVATYDAFDAKTGRIPRGAHELSAEQKFGFSIGPANAVIPLVLEGIPKSVAFIPSGNSALSGSQVSGYVAPKCHTGTQTVTVVGVDADGNYILGVGAPRVALATDDAAQLSVSRKGPNSFDLSAPVAPNYPFGGHAVRLTAKVTPNKRSGARALQAAVTVTYSRNICGVLKEFPIPTASSQPFGVTAGRDGALWFTEYAGNKIGRITTSGHVTEHPLPAPRSPAGITAGPDGNLWFAESFAHSVGRITTAGKIAEFPVPSQSWEITTGPDGNLWFTECSISKIGRITTTGTATDFPTMTPGSAPRGIVSGPGKALWFTECATNKLATIATNGSVTEYDIASVDSGPWNLAAGPNDTLLMTQYDGNQIAQATASGAITAEYPLRSSLSEPSEITAGPDGAFWFSESGGNRIGRIAPDGTVTETQLASGRDPFGITTGPDGAIWFAERAAGNIGRLY